MAQLTTGRVSTFTRTIEGGFLYCADCVAVHRVSASDRSPIYSSEGYGLATDDFQAFVAQHADHTLKVLHRANEAEIHSHARWDPMCRVSWQLSDGERSYVVTFGREDLESPRRYSIFPGELRLVSESVDVDVDVFTQAIDEALYPHAAPPRKLDALVEACRRAVRGVPADELEPIDEDRSDPNVQLACLPEPAATTLASAVRDVFDPAESQAVLELVDRDLRFIIPVVRLRRVHQIVERE